MSKALKVILMIIGIIYIISPIDFVPGPIDDLLAVVFEIVLWKQQTNDLNELK